MDINFTKCPKPTTEDDFSSVQEDAGRAVSMVFQIPRNCKPFDSHSDLNSIFRITVCLSIGVKQLNSWPPHRGLTTKQDEVQIKVHVVLL